MHILSSAFFLGFGSSSDFHMLFESVPILENVVDNFREFLDLQNLKTYVSVILHVVQRKIYFKIS